ncbi:nucleotide-binding oligomerization domain-containing protein 2 [Electrophorus electricus]|uniref:Nucleotide-binding oligomerization domain containing 2 n=1 Tax=Electrophorus electricus TaxID=8005 RepID=A0A4W4HGT2_ELEEL|nr:nucleotide-binding oligomerization domain-containing protein 2 [Electrophorus electricus]XP_026878612.2 nucleotide-binding oligomerization domain-containing protein 2 [Electrophorus electricus]
MCAQQLVLRQRMELLRALSCGATAEPLDCVLDLLLSWGVLVWEDYQSVRGLAKPLCSNTRDLLDLVYSKGEQACSLLLAAFNQVLPESQKAGLCFGKCRPVGLNAKGTPTTACQVLLSDRPILVRKLRDRLDDTLDALLEAGCFTSKDCDEVLLPVYTPSQKVRRLLDQVMFRGEGAANVLLRYLPQEDITTPGKEEKQLSAECLLYQKKLRSSVLAQAHFLSTYGGTGRFSLDDIYTESLLELLPADRATTALGLEDVVGLVGTLNEEADTVLVSGEAGTGKSTLLQRLHLLWARGVLLTEILLLFPFSCRKLSAEKRALSLKELLFLHCCWPDRGQDELFQFILDHPHLVLFTFDGLDEFRKSFTDEERHCCPTQQAPVPVLLFNLLQGTLMKGVRKVVTSRPHAVSPALKRYLRKEVFVKGFSPEGIACFVRKHHSDPTIANRVVESVQANTALLGLCHIPVFCWIVSKCYKELLGCGEGSPQTITDVYLMVLQHFFQRRVPQEHQVLGKGWLQEHLETVVRLGRLALEGVETSCYVFPAAQMQNCGITEQDIKLGFLIHCKDLSDSTDCSRYEFLHITLQCFFAAIHIVLNKHGNRSVIPKLFESQCRPLPGLNCMFLRQCINHSVEDDTNTEETPNLQIMAKFVSGLLSQRHRNLLSRSCPAVTLEWRAKQVLKCLSTGMQRHFKTIPRPVEGEKKSMHAMPSFVWLIKCIYEMQESQIAKEAVAKLEVEHLKLTYCNIGPVECTALAYVLQHLQSPIGLQLDCNTVGDVGVEQLLPCLHVCHSLYLRNNNISDEGIRKLVEKGIHCENFKKVALFNNKLTDECTKHFAWLLKSKQNFLSIRLGNNNITSQGATHLAEGLGYSQSLQYLGLWGNKIGDKGAETLAEALKDSTTLIWFSLVDNGVGNSGARALAKLVRRSTTLTELWLNQNCISRDGVEHLIQALEVNSSVKDVWLRGNNLSPEEVEELSLRESRLTF